DAEQVLVGGVLEPARERLQLMTGMRHQRRQRIVPSRHHIVLDQHLVRQRAQFSDTAIALRHERAAQTRRAGRIAHLAKRPGPPARIPLPPFCRPPKKLSPGLRKSGGPCPLALGMFADIEVPPRWVVTLPVSPLGCS